MRSKLRNLWQNAVTKHGTGYNLYGSKYIWGFVSITLVIAIRSFLGRSPKEES